MMDKKVYGVVGIGARMAMWNANFEGMPKNIDNKIYASDKSMKYSIKDVAAQQGKKVLYRKKLIFSKDGNLVPMELKERLLDEFEGLNLDKKASSEPVVKALFECWDVKQFGAACALEGHNISITGAVQIGQAFNINPNTNIVEQDILSPFRNSKKEDAQQSSIGTMTLVDDATYIYPITINPLVYKNFEDLNVTNGYTEEDYKSFKEMVKVCADNLHSNTKIGCTNSFAVFIETTLDGYLPQLDRYVKYETNGDNIIYTLQIKDLLEKLGDKVLNIEVVQANGVEVNIDGWNK